MANKPKTRKRATDEERLAQYEERANYYAEQAKAQRSKLRERKRKEQARVFGVIGQIVSKGCSTSPDFRQKITTDLKAHVSERDYDRFSKALDAKPVEADDESENAEAENANSAA